MRDVTFMEKESIITGEAIDPSEETSVHGWGVEESEESKERSQLSRRASIKLLPDGRIERVTSNIGWVFLNFCHLYLSCRFCHGA